jgi:hypothetical protein
MLKRGLCLTRFPGLGSSDIWVLLLGVRGLGRVRRGRGLFWVCEVAVLRTGMIRTAVVSIVGLEMVGTLCERVRV